MREPKLVLRPLMRNDKQVVTCLSFDQEYNILLLQDEGMKAVVALAYSDGRLGGGKAESCQTMSTLPSQYCSQRHHSYQMK